MSAPRYQLLIGALGDLGPVTAAHLPPLQPVTYTGNNASGKAEFKYLRVKYHLFPEFPDVDIANDWVTKLKTQMAKHAADSSSLDIRVGTTPADTGFFMLTPWAGGVLETHLGMLIYIAETQGDDAALSEFRRTLDGKGLV